MPNALALRSVRRAGGWLLGAALGIWAHAGEVASISPANGVGLEGAPASASPARTEQASLSKPAAAQGDGWLQRLFLAPESNPQQRAVQQLEALGLTPDADSWIRAVRAQNHALVSLFLRSGLNPDLRGAHGRTALLAAALDHHWESVGELLKAGANPSLADDAGATPLMAAAMEKGGEPLALLLKAGADVKAHDAEGHTALHYAVSALSPAHVQTLLAAGAPVAGACCAGHDLLTHAFETADARLITPILEAQTGGLNWTSEARACLAKAVETRDATMAHLLLSKHGPAPTPEGKQQPLLAYAVLENDLPKFQFLLDCGADPNTAVNSPVEKSFSAQVSSAFARLYLENEAGMTTLMLASGMDKIDFVKALLAKGARRNLLTAKYKMPALFFAAHSEIAEIMQLLIGDCPTPEQLRIEISLGSQHLSLLRDGVPIFSAPVSTGRPGFATPAGRYVITDKHLTHTSTIYKTAQMPFFMRLNCRDFGMHEGQLPGYPASHGCIRLPGSAARQLYKDVPIGTLVSISH